MQSQSVVHLLYESRDLENIEEITVRLSAMISFTTDECFTFFLDVSIYFMCSSLTFFCVWPSRCVQSIDCIYETA